MWMERERRLEWGRRRTTEQGWSIKTFILLFPVVAAGLVRAQFWIAQERSRRSERQMQLSGGRGWWAVKPKEGHELNEETTIERLGDTFGD
ncbi:MAG: hypothetical protein ACK559_07495, partial [bacterium]